MRILLYNPDNGVTRNFMPHLWMFLLQSLVPPGHQVFLKILATAVGATALSAMAIFALHLHWVSRLWLGAFGLLVFAGAGDVITDLGLDAAGPAAFLALLWPRLASPPQRRTAIAGALIAVALTPDGRRAVSASALARFFVRSSSAS